MSTFTTSDISKQRNESVEEIAQEFLRTANDYFQSELNLVLNNYNCFIEMNTATLDKYEQIYQTIQHVNNSIESINDSNNTKITSTHTQLNEIEDAMSNLESIIKHLDAYSYSLENQVKKYLE